ncbi:hypothetical protein BDF14DRAFT_1732518 [Spinellus fusiger]|nr:hypothetical protein BDF14DRAFT_1732518 [Spinellus fusiger]
MAFSYGSFISPLDSLVFDISTDPIQNEQDAAEELALWTNAQFTFDVKPGAGIFDKEEPTISTSAAITPFSAASSQFDTEIKPVAYENLIDYLDYELQQQQQQQESQSHTLVPVMTSLQTPVTQIRQLLLPKPSSTGTTLPTLLPVSTPTAPALASYPTKKSTTTKRPAVEDLNEQTADEDKRRRNTAASARFRIKKKQREQAMEQTVREMTNKSDTLQQRVNELELEVKWLRGLLTEKEAKSKA